MTLGRHKSTPCTTTIYNPTEYLFFFPFFQLVNVGKSKKNVIINQTNNHDKPQFLYQVVEDG